MKKKNIHYGQEIRKKLKERKMPVTKFADRICCSRENVYNIFKRQNINTGLLEAISEVLDFDFSKIGDND